MNGRAEIIVPGALVLQKAMEMLKLRTLVSATGPCARG